MTFKMNYYGVANGGRSKYILNLKVPVNGYFRCILNKNTSAYLIIES